MGLPFCFIGSAHGVAKHAFVDKKRNQKQNWRHAPNSSGDIRRRELVHVWSKWGYCSVLLDLLTWSQNMHLSIKNENKNKTGDIRLTIVATLAQQKIHKKYTWRIRLNMHARSSNAHFFHTMSYTWTRGHSKLHNGASTQHHCKQASKLVPNTIASVGCGSSFDAIDGCSHWWNTAIEWCCLLAAICENRVRGLTWRRWLSMWQRIVIHERPMIAAINPYYCAHTPPGKIWAIFFMDPVGAPNGFPCKDGWTTSKFHPHCKQQGCNAPTAWTLLIERYEIVGWLWVWLRVWV